MSLKTIKDNMGMGGKSYIAATLDDIKRIPETEKSLINITQLTFFETLPQSTLDLAARASKEIPELPHLAQWLTTLASTPGILEIHLPEYVVPHVWVRFAIAPRWAPALSLKAPKLPANWPLPELLKRVYSLVGDINHNGFMFAGGLVAVDSYVGPRSDKGPKLYKFYETFTGDAVAYDHAGRPHWYLHETQGILPAAPLENFLDAYFANLCAHTETWYQDQ